MKPHIDCPPVLDICKHIPVCMCNYNNKRKKGFHLRVRELSGKKHRRAWREGRMEGKMVIYLI